MQRAKWSPFHVAGPFHRLWKQQESSFKIKSSSKSFMDTKVPMTISDSKKYHKQVAL